MDSIEFETEKRYLWWLEENQPKHLAYLMAKEDFEYERDKQLQRLYQKPRYDPFLVFNPSKAFVLEVIKQLRAQSYESIKQCQSWKNQGWPVPEFLQKKSSELYQRIKHYQYKLGQKERTGGYVEQENKITEDTVATAKRVRISDLYDDHTARRGKHIIGRCPFHNEKTASFTVYLETNSFWCFGCARGGDVIDFVMMRDNIEFIPAVKLLINT